jgi:hypothetical protein
MEEKQGNVLPVGNVFGSTDVAHLSNGVSSGWSTVHFHIEIATSGVREAFNIM